MLPGKKHTPEDLLRIAWRRKWFIVVPFVVIALCTIGVSHFLPDRYRSETLILVVPQRVPETYVKSTVTSRIEDRLQSIRQTVLSRTRLEKVIDDFKLYPRERATLPMEDVVERMRARDIQVQVVKGDAFKVAYTAGNPRTAKDVAERLGSLFMDESRQDRAVMATATSDFLKSQLEVARANLQEQEKKLTEYRLKHAGELPTERQSNLQVLQNLQMQVQAVVESSNRDRDRRMFVERSLADAMSEPQTAPVAPSAADGGPSTLPASVQLENARAGLRNMRLVYKKDHPDVKKLEARIAELEKKADAEALQAPLSPGMATGRPATPEEAARRKRVADLQNELAALDLQIKDKQATEKALRDEIRTYQARVGAAPIREAELIALTRDHETLQKGYESLLARQEDAKVAENMETRQIGEQFRVLDQARIPEKPASPNRPMINLLGAVAGLGIGFGLVTLLEYRDRTMRSDDDVTLCLSLPVLALVPVMTTAAERHRARRMRLLTAVGSAVFVLVAAASALALSWSWLRSFIPR